MFTRIFVIFTLALTIALGSATAGETGKPIPLKILPTPLRIAVIERLKEMGVRPKGPISYASDSTDKCPSNCNGSSGGGFCYCDPDSEGNCPSGTSKGGSPGEEYCKVSMPKGIGGGGTVGGVGLPEFVSIEW